MQIRKQYKFYAAHRNELLCDKCFNLHGHVYRVGMFFEVERRGSENVTTLFSDFDDYWEPYFKILDHGLFISSRDPLYDYLFRFNEVQEKMRETTLKMCVLVKPSSVENICHMIFSDCILRNMETSDPRLHFQLKKIELQETDSSVVVYNYEDWRNVGGIEYEVKQTVS